MEMKEPKFITADNPPLTVDGDLSKEEELKAIEEYKDENNM